MKFKNRFSNRYNLLIIVLIILMLILVGKLAILTIAKGDYYREEADKTRVQNIPITAARGEIRDRNGKLIAGNKPSFTVQILKGELDKNEYTEEEKNSNLLRLGRLLEEDGVGYLDEFPIDLNVFKYKDEKDYLIEGQQPMDKVVRIIIEHGLVPSLLNMKYTENAYPEHYRFYIAERAMQSIRSKGTEVPIEIIYGDNVDFKFVEDSGVLAWKDSHGIAKNATPSQCIVQLIGDDKNIIRDFINHPIARMLVFNRLVEKGIQSNIILDDFVLTYDDELSQQKTKLMETYDYVTKESSAEEDFINIFKEVSLENYMKSLLMEKNFRGKEKPYAPGQKLLDLVKEVDRTFPVRIEIKEDEAVYSYIPGKEVGGKEALDYLLEYAEQTTLEEKTSEGEKTKERKLIDIFLTLDSIRGSAQSQLLRDGVNTRISIADKYEYIYINNKKKFYNNNRIYVDQDAKKLEIDMDASPEYAFNKIREELKISKDLSKYEARSIMLLNNILKEQGYSSYQPINVAYGIKDSTVAKIEEGMADIPGVGVSIEPVRYYPEGETAAHIIGYLGRISQENEIKKYVDEKGYFRNDIIGKTGIEESFEDNLRGKNGSKRVEVDALGNITATLSEIKPIPGDNIYLSIDLDVQKKAEESLKQTLDKIRVGGTYTSEWGNYTFGRNRSKGGIPYKNATSGATVALDVNTGDVIAMASYPSYDPNLFSTGISNSDWASLFPENDKDQLAPRPLYNIATQTAVQPGSTYKMATALAGLEKGIKPTQTIYDGGYVQLGEARMQCHIYKNGGGSHGNVDVYKALKDSCNYYFYSLGLGRDQRRGISLGAKVEIEDIIDISTQMGLDDKTGIEINIPAERSGGVPNPKLKQQGMKNMLKNFLNVNIREFLIEDREYEEEELIAIVEEIASWTDYEETLTKAEVVSKLRELGVNGEKRVPGSADDLGDKIKYDYLNQSGWSIGDTLNVTIGQGYGQYTPIQMANFIATLSNGGYKNKLTLIDNIKKYDNSKIEYSREVERERMKLNNYENLEHVKKGMKQVSDTGTSRRTFGQFPISTGSKTGTAQKAGKNPVTGEKYDDFGWFVGFGPYENPEIAVATVLFQGGSGGSAGPMTRDIMAEHLGLNSVENKDELPFKNSLTQ